MAKKKSSATIDPRGQDVVLAYIGAPEVHGSVPSRDLHGGDLNRIAYVRELRAREAAHASFRRAQDDESPQPDLVLPGLATGEQLEAIADELVSTGNFERTEPADQPDEPPATTQPIETATAAEEAVK